jgi:hypothetical protein
MLRKVSCFLAVVMTALSLLPGGAHVMSLPAKIAMPEDPYFVVQQIYRGWALAGAVIILAILANFAAAILAQGTPRRLFVAAGMLIALTLAIFFTWTYPANQATGNWTSVPENWEQLRTQWEYSHAVNAVITFVALLCAVGASLSAGRRQEAGDGTETAPSARAHERPAV